MWSEYHLMYKFIYESHTKIVITLATGDPEDDKLSHNFIGGHGGATVDGLNHLDI